MTITAPQPIENEDGRIAIVLNGIVDVANRIEHRLGRPNTAFWAYEEPQEIWREIGATYVFAPPRVFETLLTLTMVRMEDAGNLKRSMFHFFIDHANKGDSVFTEYGATRVLECWGDDVKDGKQVITETLPKLKK